MEMTTFKEECEKLISRFPDLDKELLNEVWRRYKTESDQFIKGSVRFILTKKIPGRDTVTIADFEPQKKIETAPEIKTWPGSNGLNNELKKRGASSLWEAVKLEAMKRRALERGE